VNYSDKDGKMVATSVKAESKGKSEERKSSTSTEKSTTSTERKAEKKQP
jgi:hypothetical protein